jgi:hypothetical protein
MEDVGYDKRHLVVSGLMATFKKIWVDAWSARMEYILTNTLLALLEYPGATLLGVNRMYTDKAYRKKVVDNVKDPVVKDFWIKEFAIRTPTATRRKRRRPSRTRSASSRATRSSAISSASRNPRSISAS